MDKRLFGKYQMAKMFISIALTNHAFFNLDGFGGDIKEHTIVINNIFIPSHFYR